MSTSSSWLQRRWYRQNLQEERRSIEMRELQGNLSLGHGWQDPCSHTKQPPLPTHWNRPPGIPSWFPTISWDYMQTWSFSCVNSKRSAESNNKISIYMGFIDLTLQGLRSGPKRATLESPHHLRMPWKVYWDPQTSPRWHECYSPLSWWWRRAFQVKSGIKQGCVIVPTLFIIFAAAITHIIKNDLLSGLDIVYRTDGRVFNLSRLRSKNRTSVTSLMEFRYADDNCVMSTSEDHLQQILDAFNSAYIHLGLSINPKMTQILYQPCNCKAWKECRSCSSLPHHRQRSPGERWPPSISWKPPLIQGWHPRWNPVSTEMRRSRLRPPSNACLSKQEHPDGHKIGRLQSCRAPDATLCLRDLDNLSLPPKGTGEVPPTLPAEHSQHLLGELPHQHQRSAGGQDHQRRSHRHQEPVEVDRPRRQDAGLQTAETNLLLSAQRRETQSRRPEEERQRSFGKLIWRSATSK